MIRIFFLLATVIFLSLPKNLLAIPAFARQYKVSCNTCHAAYPKLNSYGEQFADDNYRMANWRDTITDTGDGMLALPKFVPISIRAMAYTQIREGKYLDPVTGDKASSDTDFQAPYMIKILSSAPLSERISFYFYAILAEKGENGTVIVEDAWFSYNRVFNLPLDMMIGQFQISDLMFPRELRLTFQDYMIYRMSGITYDRGIILSTGFEPISLELGAVNGNGIEENLKINSPGYKRPDHMFDTDRKKMFFGRTGIDFSIFSAGIFGLYGKHKTKLTTKAGTDSGKKYTDKKIYGFDFSSNINEQIFFFLQYLYNDWGKYFDNLPGKNFSWWGVFAGIDYIYSDKVVLSLLYNYADAGDFDGTSTIYEGININTVTGTFSYYFMRNVKGVIEVTYDFLSKDNDPDFVGHETKEGYILIGFDAAF